MKHIILLCLAAIAIHKTELSAVDNYTISTLSMEESPIIFEVRNLEGFQKREIEDIDLVFQYSDDANRRVAFHYFNDPEFDTKSVNLVFDYTEWLCQQILEPGKRTQTQFNTRKDYALHTFRYTDAENRDTYCHMYIGKAGGEMVFASIALSSQSLADAIKDNEKFLEGIVWKKNTN